MYQVTLSGKLGSVELVLSLNDKCIFNAIIESSNAHNEDNKIKVCHVDMNKNDPFLDLFLNTSIKDNIITIPNFITLRQGSNNIIAIDQDQTFPKMYPCTLILNLGFVAIYNLSVSTLDIINGKVAVDKTLLANTIKSCCDILVYSTGTVQAESIEVNNALLDNSGKVTVSKNMKVNKGALTNFEIGVMDVQHLEVSESGHENKGELITRGFIQKLCKVEFTQQPGSKSLIKSDVPFSNNGTWIATGLVDFGRMLFRNKGTINWTKVDFRLEESGIGHWSSGTWTFDEVKANNQIFITNCGVMHLKNSELQFNWLLNRKNLIISSGKYYVRGLQNWTNALISFIDNEFTFSDQKKLNGVNHYLTSDRFGGPVGKFESEKNFNYFHHNLPDEIVCQSDLHFSQQNIKDHRLKYLKNVKCSGTVHYYCKDIKLKKNKKITDIAHLSLNIEGNFTNPEYSFTALGLTLDVKGILVNGLSNEKMGTIVADGQLHLTAHSIDNKFGKIYGKRKTRIHVGKEDLMNGSAISKGPFRYGLNGSYIASGKSLQITVAKEFKNHYGQVYSHKPMHLKGHIITNLAGEIICGNDIKFTAHSFTNTRDAVYRAGVADWTWAYTQCAHDFESSDQAFVRSLGSIYFEVSIGTNLASTILAQKDIQYYTKSAKEKIFSWFKSGSYTSEQPSTFTSVARNNWGWGLHDRGGTHQSGSPVSVYPSTLQAGQSIKIDTGSFTISSNMNSPIIAITANNGHFNNTARHRKNVNCQATIFVDLTQLIQQQVANKKGFLRLTSKGKVKSDLGNKKALVHQSSVMLVTEDNQHLYDLPFNKMNILNPLQDMPSDFLNLFIQSTLSEVAGKVHIKDLNGQSLAKKLLSNADLFQQETHKALVNKKDLYQRAPYVMILQELKKVNDVLQSQTVLCVPPQEICEFQSEGDIGANEFACTTENDQIHSNNRIIARDILDVMSKKGSVKRQTESYVQVTYVDDSIITQDVAMPKQTFVCLNGNVNIKAHKDSISVGTDTVAVKGDIVETIETGNIINKPLILQKTVETKEKDGNLLSSTETVTRDITHSTVQTRNIAGQHIMKTGKEKIEQIATQDVAGTKIVYDAKNITIESAILANSKEVTKESTNGFTEKREYDLEESATISQASINAPTIIFKGDMASLKGVNVVGQELIDETVKGLYVGPQVQELKYTKQVTVESPLSSLDAGCKGGYEVMVQSRLAIDKIIRLVDNKEIILESVLWSEKRTEVIGKIIETNYELKKWHLSWCVNKQAIPDEALIIVSVAVAFATYGTGATLMGTFGTVGAMSSAGFTTLCTAATTNFLKTGDPIMTAKSLLTDDFVRNLAINIASVGICDKLGVAGRPDVNGSIVDFAKHNALKAIVNVPLNTVIGKQDINEVLKGELVNVIVDTAQQFTAAQIGRMYRDGDLNFLNHKISHAVSGAATGAVNNLILNKPIIEGALSSATGAVIGELAAELNPLNIQDIDTQLFTSKIIAGTVALLLKQDVGLSIKTATNTLENNWFHCIMAALSALGLTHAIKDAMDAYEESGLDAAIDVLVLHGIVMRLEKGVMHYGGKIFSSAKDLWKQVSLDKAKNIWEKIIGKKNLLDPKSVINRDLLYHKLSIQEKMGEIGTPFAGGNTGKVFRDEPRIINQYGGEIGDWVKKSSSKFTTKAGQDIELHWIENVKTGKRVEYKQKLIN
ncbi:putative hemagglutinin [Indivirus ILV1]|uniref:Putative hemagglutinin n=1 Tax=Indivirus ILV1 TaxID=1977633 RepID=A0A1V0SD22_9VIRU|nr:putative hemagglutinin [Indivirus ILV1]